MRRDIHFSALLAAGGSLLLAASGCDGKAFLEPFESCEELEDYIEDQAIKQYTYNGPVGYGIAPPLRGAPMDNMAMEDGASGGTSQGGGNSHSSTNTQERGVDEADFVKNDGEFIYVVGGDSLRIVDAWPAEEMNEVGVLAMEGWPEAMYLDGDQVAVLSHLYDEASPEGDRQVQVQGFVTKVSVVDVTDRTSPRLTRELYVEGSLYDSRRIGNHLYLITYRDLAESGIEYWDQKDSEIKDQVRERTLEQWMPRRAMNDRDGESWSVRDDQICDCTSVYRPNRDGGLAMMTVLTIDLADPDSVPAGTSVLAGVGEVYATPDSLYLAVYEAGSGPWRVNSASAAGTRIHKFDLTESVARPVYKASGRVDGHVLNSFAMDEADDHFRVATTSFEGRNWTPVSGLYMLRQASGELMQVGEVTGIEPGEEIYAVRFMDDAAYVVTFFQMDPLFTFDLSDPENPQQVGELEITGFSTYLHPLGGSHLIGVGEEVAPNSGMFEGMQISLFDVSDLANPTMTDRVVIDTGWSWSEALYDHHAFNYYGPLDMLAIPVSYEGAEYGTVSFAGLHAYEITPGNDILLMGEIDASALIDPDVEDPYYGQYCAQVRRSVIIEDVVYAISSGGIIAAGVDDLSTPYAVLAFPDHGNCDQTWEWWMM